MTSTSHVPELELLRKQVADLSRQLAERDRLLQEQTWHLRIAQAMAHVGTWVWEIESGRMIWSDELYDIFGQRPGEIDVTYDTFLAALLPDDHERAIAAMNAALAATAPYDIECRIVRPDGEVRTIHSRGEIRRSDAGHPLLMSGITRDITDRKGTEFARQQSEAYFRTLIEHSSDIITVLDLDGTIRFESPSFERLLGYSQNEIDGRIAFEFVHPDDLPAVLEKFQLVIQRPGEPQAAEFRFRHKNGSWRSFEGIGRPILDQQGHLCVLVNSRDLTERRLAEEALRRAEGQYRAIFEQAGVGVVEVDSHTGRFLKVNRRYCDIVGLTLAETLAISFMSITHPDDLKDELVELERLRNGAISSFTIEKRFVRRDGSIVWVSLNVVPLWQPGEEAASHIAVVHDITARKQAEEALRESETRYQSLIEAIPQQVWTARPDGTLDYVNRRVLDYFDCQPDDLLGWEWQSVLHPDDLPACLANWTSALCSGEPYEIEFRLRRTCDGAYRWHLARAMPVKDASNRILKWFGTNTDITERKQVEEALRISQERHARATAIGRVGVWELDVASGSYYGDVNLKALFGYDDDELSTDPYVWLNLVHPEDQSIALDHWQRIVSGTMDHYNYEIRMIRKDGTVIWTEVRGRAVRNREGQVSRLIGATVDITERKMTQEALAKSEGQLRTVLNALPVGVWLTDQSGQWLLSNPAAKQIWSNIRSIEPEPLIGRSKSHEPASEPHGSAANHMLARGIGPGHETLDLECTDGTRKTIRKTTVPIFDDASNVLGALILNEDISTLRQAEEALKLTQFSVDRAVEGFLWIAADGRILNVNQAACRMLEYLPDELTTLSMHDINPSLFPETWAAQWNDLKRKGSLTFESKHWSKTGRVLDMEVTANYLCYEGREYNCLIMRDISERKRAEGALRRSHAFLRQVIDTDPNFIFAKDRGGRFTLANKAVADCYGTTVEQLIGKTDADVNPNRGEAECFPEMDHDVLDSLRDRFIPEEAITDVTGRIRWLQTVKRPIFDEHGLPMVLGASTEITERKRAEEALRQRERDLRAAMEERERISEDLHDGILQSLYAVGLGLESCKPLIRHRKHEQATVLLEHAIGQLNHVMTEVRNFIAGLESQVLQGGDFVTALQTMVQTLSASAGTACRVSIEEAAARQLSTEQALHLMNVVREALSNSLRHSRAKRITVSLKPLAEVIRLAVADNGVGFKPAAAQGVGHGLANMAARAQKIGGRFVLRSRPHKGTKILLDLPMVTMSAHP